MNFENMTSTLASSLVQRIRHAGLITNFQPAVLVPPRFPMAIQNVRA
jgi:hypothetical protein